MVRFVLCRRKTFSSKGCWLMRKDEQVLYLTLSRLDNDVANDVHFVVKASADDKPKPRYTQPLHNICHNLEICKHYPENLVFHRFSFYFFCHLGNFN